MSDTWTHLISLLKTHDGNPKYFFLVTDYDGFVVNDLQISKDNGIERIKYSEIRRNENIAAIWDELRMRNITFDSNDNWTNLLTKLKENEGNEREFKPSLPIDRVKVMKQTRNAPSATTTPHTSATNHAINAEVSHQVQSPARVAQNKIKH